MDSQGEEIDRIVGYMPPEPFVKEVGRIRRGENTLRSLRAKWAEADRTAETGLLLARKLADANSDDAEKVLSELAALDSAGSPEIRARIGVLRGRVALERGDLDEALRQYEGVVDAAGASDAALEAALISAAYLVDLDPEKGLELMRKAGALGAKARGGGRAARLEARLHLEVAGRALARQAQAAGDDPMELNEAAWAAFLAGVKTDEALGWARRAVDLSKREDAAILDTFANLLFEAGETDEAVKVQTEAVGKAKDPEMRAELAEALARFTAVQILRSEKPKSSVDDDDDDEEDDDEEDDEEDDD